MSKVPSGSPTTNHRCEAPRREGQLSQSVVRGCDQEASGTPPGTDVLGVEASMPSLDSVASDAKSSLKTQKQSRQPSSTVGSVNTSKAGSLLNYAMLSESQNVHDIRASTGQRTIRMNQSHPDRTAEGFYWRHSLKIGI
ncbi:unnamed protein product [Taenia asiatica]|uniref:J domain-containing protein n=1 Tax=Taenia asiatica TaxID=60517 RepID=A0A0R3W3P6_TAEAS|nr:unnamed protein product [Taenia asiatica]